MRKRGIEEELGGCENPPNFLPPRESKEQKEEKRRAGKRRCRRQANSRNRDIISTHLELNPCSACGNNDIRVLEFHHSDPSEKEESVTRMGRSGYSADRIRAEIAKCVVLCANCHRIYHSNLRDYERL